MDPRPAPTPPKRRGSVAKRAAILDTARHLFATEGFDRVSMDAIAARAKVSKATLYDYFGDKRSLFLAILTDASAAVADAAEVALQRHLDAADVTSPDDLEAALCRCATELAVEMLRPTGPAAVFGLIAQQRWQSTNPGDDVSTEPAVAALAQRIERFAAAGVLDVDDAHLAAMHFGALTILLAHDAHPDPTAIDVERIGHVVAGGVRTFMRAFAHR